ncbi:MAG: thiolase family protein [Nitrososphaerota archaeon]
MKNDAVIVAATRTPIGKYAGILKTVRPDDLASHVMKALISQAAIEPSLIEDVYFGCSNQAGEDNRNIARMAALLSGLPYTVPGATVNRLCGSGLEAINDAARVIWSGEAQAVIAGGVESMTRAPLVALKPDIAYKRGGMKLVDTTIGWRFVNPSWPKEYPPYEMGETAENLAEKYKIKRSEQDEFSLSSHKKAIKAIDSGRFAEEITAVPTQEHPEGVNVDEGPRRDTSLEKLSLLKPAFREGGTVTAGNSSQISDGAAAVLILSEKKAEELSIKPIAKVLGSAVAGVHPSYMGLGPVPATRKLMQRLGMQLQEFDVVELNEAFASQVIACFEEMPELMEVNLNPNGGAIALGHPIGCSGARIAVTLLHEMKRKNSRYGLATMCIGVGQGIATAFELL